MLFFVVLLTLKQRTKGEKADWNQINHSKSTDNQSNLGNQKFSFFPLAENNNVIITDYSKKFNI